MTRRWAGGFQLTPIYPALLDEAQRRQIEVVVIANRHRVRPTPKRCRVELAKVPWNTFDVGLLVEAEDTIATRDPMLQKHRVLAVDQDASNYGIDSVAFADAQAGALAARHLLELGHTRFAVTEEVGDPGMAFDPCWTVRRHGFEMALGEAGAALLPQWRLPVPRRGFIQTSDDPTKSTIAAWAAAPLSKRPTALFVIALNILGGLLEELAQHGLRVPRDLSIVTTAWVRHTDGGEQPTADGMRFTNIDFDLSALARRTFDAAAELADEKPSLGKKPRRPPKVFLVPVILTPGQSTAPPKL
jgi:DNA-binding LacI/PurR family transcriptional regulator